MRTTAARLAASTAIACAIAACGQRPPSDVEVGKALGTALSDHGRNPLWEMSEFKARGSRYDGEAKRMIASVDYTVRLRTSRADLMHLLDAALQAPQPQAETIDRLETAIAFFDVALGKDWPQGASYVCRNASLPLVRGDDGWVLPPDQTFALCPPR